MLKVIKRLEENLTDSQIGILEPRFILIGLVMEGTRILKASEIDVTVTFKYFSENPFKLGKDATELLISNSNNDTQMFCTNGKFDYAKFMSLVLTCIKTSVNEIHLPPLFGKCLPHPQLQCEKCIEVSEESDSIYAPFKHCIDHPTTVTHTKLGPCLIFQEMDEKSEVCQKKYFTVDLIPVFPIQTNEGILGLVNMSTKTLLHSRPQYWLDYYESLMKRDIILPDAFKKLGSQTLNKSSVDIAIKLLHHGPEPNFMIRAAQDMECINFRENEVLRKIYVYMKCIKEILEIPAKSYFMKKVILRDEFLFRTRDSIERFDELLHDALSHEDLKPLFEKRIDFQQWKDGTYGIDYHKNNGLGEKNYIPLKRKLANLPSKTD